MESSQPSCLQRHNRLFVSLSLPTSLVNSESLGPRSPRYSQSLKARDNQKEKEGGKEKEGWQGTMEREREEGERGGRERRERREGEEGEREGEEGEREGGRGREEESLLADYSEVRIQDSQRVFFVGPLSKTQLLDLDDMCCFCYEEHSVCPVRPVTIHHTLLCGSSARP